MLFTAIFSLVFSLGIYFKGKNKVINNTAIFFFFTIFIWALGRAFMDICSTKQLALFFLKFSYSGSVWMPLAFLLFCWAILEKKFNKPLVFILSLISFVLFILNFYGYIVIDLQPKLNFQFYDVPGGYAFEFFSNYYSLILAYAFIELIIGIIKNQGQKKIQIIYLLIASLIGFVPSFTTFPLVKDIPLYPFGVPIIAFYTFILAFGIIKYELADITLIINRILAYFFVLIFIIPTVLVPLYLPINFSLKTIIVCFVTIFWAFATIPCHKFLITKAKRKFIKGYYDPDAPFNIISKKLAKENDRTKIFNIMAQVLDKQMQFEKIAVLLAVRTKDKISKYVFIEKEPETNNTLNEETLEQNHSVIQFLTKQIKPFFLNQKDLKTENKVAKFFTHYDFPKNTFCLPFVSVDGLEGMIILGERSCGIILKQKELDIFDTIISHVSALLYKYTSVEKVRKEFESSQKQLFEEKEQRIRAEKIASLVRTTQECQHEIRTPVAAIKLWLNGLSEHPSTNEIEEFRKVAIKHINRLLYVVDASLSLATNKKKQLEKVNINEVIEEATTLIPPYGYHLAKKLEEVPLILGVKAELVSVFLNFLNNAKKAMQKNGGTLTIKSFFDENSKYVIIKVTDTGVGIAPENLERIWEPYFTTDKTYGHGLGLSIIHQIVQSYKGIVQVESVLKKGTTFTLKFPAER